MKINRTLVEHALAEGAPLQSIVNRCVGKTTKAILYAVAKSYDNFGERIPVDDPDIYKINDKRWLALKVQDFIRTNELSRIDVVCRGSGQVFIINTFAENLT